MNTALAVFTIVLSLFPLRAIVVAQENSSGDETSRHLAHAEELFEQGHSAESKQICESLLKTSPDGATAQRAFALNLLSKIYALQGDYDRAIAFAQRSADTYQRAGDQNGEAHAFNNKGIAELQNGSYSAAQPDLEKALVLSQNVHDLENQVQIQNNLGSAYFFRGSYSEAMRNYEQALSLVNGNSSAKWSGYWLQITKFNQATLLQRLGRYENALHAYREVETSSKTLTGDDRAHLYANLGTLYRRLGDPYKALDMYRAAQQLYLTQHDADGEIAVLKNSGIANALDLEDAKQAASIFRSVLALAVKTHNRREEMQAHLYLGETLFRAGSLSPARKEFEQTNSLARELATAEEQWKSLYGLGRIEASAGNIDTAERDYREAISLIEQTRGQLQLAALRSEFFADKREVYDALILILIKKNELDESFLFLERSRSRNFQDSLQKNQGGAPLTLQHVQTSLPPATLLLEFWTAGNETAVVWCTRDAAGIQTRQLTAEQQEKLQAALKRMPESLEDPDEKTIFDEVLPTDWRFPRDVRHLLIVADAWISSLPFELLHTPDDSKSLLVDRYDISYLPSAALLRRNIADRHVYWPWNRELVAFGDPVVKTSEITNGKQDAAPLNEQSIPYSREEIDEIAHPAASLDVIGNDQARKARGVEICPVFLVSDDVGLIAEIGVQLAERKRGLVTVRAGGQQIFGKNIVLHAGIEFQAGREVEKIPQRNSGVGVAADGLRHDGQ